MAEWLRRQPAKLVGSARTGSNPVGVVCPIFFNLDLDEDAMDSMTMMGCGQNQKKLNLPVAGFEPATSEISSVARRGFEWKTKKSHSALAIPEWSPTSVLGKPNDA